MLSGSKIRSGIQFRSGCYLPSCRDGPAGHASDVCRGQWDINGTWNPPELERSCYSSASPCESSKPWKPWKLNRFLQMALIFEPNSLYILLMDLSNTFHFEWRLFLASTTTTGQVFYINNDAGSVAWEYKSEMANMSTNARLVAALEIGVVGSILNSALGARLGLVPLTVYSVRYQESLCCRVWVQEALFALDDEGYLNIGKTVKEVQQEGSQLATLNKSRGTKWVVRSSGFVA